MSLELSDDQVHLSRHRVGYDLTRDEITFLPFVHSAEERVNTMALKGHPITSCETIKELFLARSGNMAGIRIGHVRAILQQNALELHARDEQGEPLDGFILLEYAELYAVSIAVPGADLTARQQELERVRERLKSELLPIPQEVRELMAA